MYWPWKSTRCSKKTAHSIPNGTKQRCGHCQSCLRKTTKSPDLAGASLRAKTANANMSSLNTRGALRFFASALAPTGQPGKVRSPYALLASNKF
ncbi:hypothetical protein C9382_19180 [Pseudomonas aylmerensis]|uniref:Uncharacterized protein n=1 Tax=Pseudomonas aylmerensis TaxID=1869229 RepID=A0A2T4FU24_9PSED|nr:hypothetical protein C9382_19180 [Pseudomonas aylmerensis]